MGLGFGKQACADIVQIINEILICILYYFANFILPTDHTIHYYMLQSCILNALVIN